MSGAGYLKTDSEIQAGLEALGYTSVQKITEELGPIYWQMLDGTGKLVQKTYAAAINEVE